MPRASAAPAVPARPAGTSGHADELLRIVASAADAHGQAGGAAAGSAASGSCSGGSASSAGAAEGSHVALAGGAATVAGATWRGEEQSPWLSRLLMRWLTPVILEGASRRLEEADELRLVSRDEPAELWRRFQVERALCPDGGTVTLALWRVFRGRVCAAMALNFLTLLLELAGPLLLHRVVEFIQASQQQGPDGEGPRLADGAPPLWHGLLYAAGLALVQFTYALAKAHSMYMIKLAGCGIRAIMMTSLQRSVMRAPVAAQQAAGESSGKLVRVNTRALF